MAVLSRSWIQINPPPFVGSTEGNLILQWAQRELENLLRLMNNPNELRLSVQNAAPAKPRAGMIAYADGTHWNPGAGEGIYYYKSTGVWTQLG